MSVSKGFTFNLGDKEIVGHSIMFPNNCYIWIGEKGNSSMGSLVGILPTRFDPISTSTPFINCSDEATETCSSIGRKLSTVFKIPIFIASAGICEIDTIIITSHLKEFLSKHFNKS